MRWVYVGFTFCSAAKANYKDEQDDGSGDATAAAADRSHAYLDVSERFDSSDVIQEVEKDAERSSDVRSGHTKQQDLVVFTTKLFTRL